ncbi:MAG TPA: ABC transporter permease, partial [Thiobacillaceae bacterium]|nr:ABC transporter permease [Thiobacillaceae bacterium]
MKPVLLWSDALILVLLALVAAGVWLARHNETFRGPLRQVWAHPVGASTALILALYVGIGLLDSLHYVERLPDAPGQAASYSGEVKSALDRLLTPLREKVEKSYSAPFATHLYAKETMTGPDGKEVRDFPRLKHGGAHLADPEKAFWPDVLKRGGLGVLMGLVAWLVLHAIFLRGGRRRAVSMTLLGILVTTGLLVALAPHYHVLGTDKVGQDVLYLSLKSVRTGLLIGTLTTLVML